jgi:hypothetical protein
MTFVTETGGCEEAKAKILLCGQWFYPELSVGSGWPCDRYLIELK